MRGCAAPCRGGEVLREPRCVLRRSERSSGGQYFAHPACQVFLLTLLRPESGRESVKSPVVHRAHGVHDIAFGFFDRAAAYGRFRIIFKIQHHGLGVILDPEEFVDQLQCHIRSGGHAGRRDVFAILYIAPGQIGCTIALEKLLGPVPVGRGLLALK